MPRKRVMPSEKDKDDTRAAQKITGPALGLDGLPQPQTKGLPLNLSPARPIDKRKDCHESNRVPTRILSHLHELFVGALEIRHEKEMKMNTGDFSIINNALIAIAVALGILCMFGALITFAMSQANDVQGGATSQKALMGFAAAAIACFGAAGLIAANPLQMTF